jgi:hypothetical protein
MKNLDLTNIWNDAYNALNAFSDEAISHVLDNMKSSTWPDIRSVTRQLSMASCAAGSWSGAIYYHDLRAKLASDDWQDAINKAIEDYIDSTGDTPKFEQCEDMITFAIDSAAHRVLCYLESLDQVWIVTCASDSLDPNPDCVAFSTEWEAIDFASDEVQRRIDYLMQHSQESVSEEQLNEWQETESQLVTVSTESTY